MNDQKLQLTDKIKGAKNVLVTVSTNPSLDQLAAAIGLTLILNKLDKHATAVYSGETPSAMEFLRPEDTLEKNTDSLRDFIISLDKAKADKLRYKVEERVVKIFITPYRTSLTADDLEFSQGDFNVDVVVAIGVHFQQDLDAAITAHGRILHDAVVTTINNTPDGDLGSINWQDSTASSLSEQVAALAADLGAGLLDNQIATALLTGIVAETGRFRNTKTTPRTMSLAAELMSAGANQQLVASQLEDITEPAHLLAPKPQEVTADTKSNGQDQPAITDVTEPPKSNDGTLEIEHDETQKPDDSAHSAHSDSVADAPAPDQPQPAAEPIEPVLPEVQPPEQQNNVPEAPYDGPQIGEVKSTDTSDEPHHTTYEPATPKFVTEPPTMGGVLTANSRPEALDPSVDPLGVQSNEAPLLDRSDHPQYDNGDKPSPDLSALNDSFDGASDGVNGASGMNAASSPASSPTYTPQPDSGQPSLASLLDSSAVSSTGQSPPADPQQPIGPQAPTNQTPVTDLLPELDQLQPPAGPSASQPAQDPSAYEHETLDEIEAEVHHDEPGTPAPAPESSVDDARQAVEDAINALPDAGDNGPILALNAQPFGEDLRGPDAAAPPPLTDPLQPIQPAQPDPLTPYTPPAPMGQDLSAPAQPQPGSYPAAPVAPTDQFTMPVPPSITMPPADSTSPTASPTADPSAPPPVPPPLMPPGFVNPNQQ
jgi:hypothetical protein